MRNAIIRGIYEVVYTPVRVLDALSKAVKWLADRFDGVACWVWSFRKPPPKHRLTDELAEQDWPPSEPEQDWLPVTPLVHQARCPGCGDDEFPLVVYDNQLMCPVCKDEAVITDRTFGHTGPQRVVGVPGWPQNVC